MRIKFTALLLFVTIYTNAQTAAEKYFPSPGLAQADPAVGCTIVPVLNPLSNLYLLIKGSS
jgi:hypothetical protein